MFKQAAEAVRVGFIATAVDDAVLIVAVRLSLLAAPRPSHV